MCVGDECALVMSGRVGVQACGCGCGCEGTVLITYVGTM